MDIWPGYMKWRTTRTEPARVVCQTANTLTIHETSDKVQFRQGLAISQIFQAYPDCIDINRLEKMSATMSTPSFAPESSKGDVHSTRIQIGRWKRAERGFKKGVCKPNNTQKGVQVSNDLKSELRLPMSTSQSSRPGHRPGLKTTNQLVSIDSRTRRRPYSKLENWVVKTPWQTFNALGIWPRAYSEKGRSDSAGDVVLCRLEHADIVCSMHFTGLQLAQEI